MAHVSPTLLTAVSFRDFGDVISARDDLEAVSCNMGTAQKFNFTAELRNLRGENAKPNLSFFSCQPQVRPGQTEFEIRLLEKHPHSTQAFIPMAGTERFLVIVARGEKAPDLLTLRAFVASGAQGITYRPGIWHHPLVAMDRTSNFACLVWEDGTDADCEVLPFQKPLTLQLPKR